MSEGLFDNPAWAAGGAAPKLSVLIPFKGDDPCALLQALDAQAAPAEVVLLDDGTSSRDLTARVQMALNGMRLPARLVTLDVNEGRAKGRNRLARHARADALLFLDADMLPDSPDFLGRWIAAGDAPIAFGGFSLQRTPVRRETALNRAMASRTETLPAAQRALAPEKYVYTSNLLVGRAVFDAIAFDEGFSGWGWEDVEWAMRAARAYPILHIDNTASHLGLDPAPVMAAKFEQSAANFGRVVASHIEVVSSYPSYRVARLLKRLPLRRVWRPMVKATALADALPLRLRAFAMRLYRAALYIEAV
jgi:glycosyltransferase involved in cell wall biosynthesis